MLLPGWAFPEPGGVRPAPEREGRLKPMLLPRACPVPDVVWTDEEWQRIRAGLRPREMEDKWVSHTAEGVLRLHRSWTGFEIWSVRVTPVRGGWRPGSALAEAHPDRFRGAADPELLARVLGLAARGYGWRP
ncbi:hypothetical protein [Kitasatospora sp. NPDC087271]|uniref:hypothetical protein n=1 Tax=Kitasatospora sp. NPDC087271 TaxID=3364067 RepID=UPI00382C483B